MSLVAATRRTFGGLGYDGRVHRHPPAAARGPDAGCPERPGRRRRRPPGALHALLVVHPQVAPHGGVRGVERGRPHHQAPSKDAVLADRSACPGSEYQIDNTLYEGTVFDRGHIAKREDLLWGGQGIAKQANDDSFCYTNATPQHEKFNRLAPALWKSLEDEIFSQVDVAEPRIALVGGPIFSAARPSVRARRAPPRVSSRCSSRGTSSRWWPTATTSDNRVKALAFRLSQESLLGARAAPLRPAGPVQVPHVPGGRRRGRGADRA